MHNMGGIALYDNITNIKITGCHWQLALAFFQIPNSPNLSSVIRLQ